MKLSVASWYPYRHQMSALAQLLGDLPLPQIALSDSGQNLLDRRFGPFLALIEDGSEHPIVGVPAIVEAMHRRYPERKLLPHEPLARAMSRALAGRVEECITRMAIADIRSHKDFDRPIWLDGSLAPATILDDYPARVATLEEFHRRGGARYLAGDHPSMADCLLAAMWWTAEDQGLDAALKDQPNLARWHAENCAGQPFLRP